MIPIRSALPNFCCNGKLDNRTYSKSPLNGRRPSLEIYKNGTLFKCLKCGKQFNYSLDLKHHNSTFHKNSYNCSICQLSFLDSETLSLHENVIHSGRETNPNVSNGVTQGNSIFTSISRRPPSNNDCELPKPFVESEFFNTDTDEKPIPICILCCETFKCDSELRLHEGKEHSNGLEGNKIAPTSDLLKPTTCLSSKENNITPAFDPQKPTDSSYLLDILNEVYSSEETNAYKLSLEGSEKATGNLLRSKPTWISENRVNRGVRNCKLSLKGSENSTSNLQSSKPIWIFKNGVNCLRVYRCNVCYEKHASLIDLQNHRKDHFKAKDCPICHETFFRDIDLSEHLKNMHMKDFSKIIFKTGTENIEVINTPNNVQLVVGKATSNSVVHGGLREMNRTCYSKNILKPFVVPEQQLMPDSEKSCQHFKNISTDRVCKLVLEGCDALVSETGDSAFNSFLSDESKESINTSSQDFQVAVDSQSDSIVVTCKTEITEASALEISNNSEEISIQQHRDLCENELKFSVSSQSVVTSAQPDLNNEYFIPMFKTEFSNTIGECSIPPIEKTCKIILKRCDEKLKILPLRMECKVVLTRCDEVLNLDCLKSSKRNADGSSEICSSHSSNYISDNASSVYNPDTSFCSRKKLKVDKRRIRLMERNLKKLEEKQKLFKKMFLTNTQMSQIDNQSNYQRSVEWCLICNKKFVSKSQLFQHKYSKHSDDLDTFYTCEVCEFSFTDADYFAFHVKTCTKLIDI